MVCLCLIIDHFLVTLIFITVFLFVTCSFYKHVNLFLKSQTSAHKNLFDPSGKYNNQPHHFDVIISLPIKSQNISDHAIECKLIQNISDHATE